MIWIWRMMADSRSRRRGLNAFQQSSALKTIESNLTKVNGLEAGNIIPRMKDNQESRTRTITTFFWSGFALEC